MTILELDRSDESPRRPSDRTRPVATTSDFCSVELTRHSSANNLYLEHASDDQFGALWREVEGSGATLTYAQLDATGEVVSGPAPVSISGDDAAGPVMAWNGSEWGVVWFQKASNRWDLMFRRLQLDGTPLGEPVRVNDEYGEPLMTWTKRPGLSSDSAGWSVVWDDWRGEHVDVYYTHLAPEGTKEMADVLVSDGTGHAWEGRVAFNGTDAGVIWVERRDGGSPQIRYRRVSLNGVPGLPSVAITREAGMYWASTDLAWDGSQYGVTWIGCNSGYGTCLRLFDSSGQPLSGEESVSPALGMCDRPTLRWDGELWVISVESYGFAGGSEVYLVYADEAGAYAGSYSQLSFPGGDSTFPALAVSNHTRLTGWQQGLDNNGYGLLVRALDRDGGGSSQRRSLGSPPTTSPGLVAGPEIAATGTDGHALAWRETGTTKSLGHEIHLRLINGHGTTTTEDVAVAALPDESVYEDSAVAVASSGDVVAIVWGSSDRNLMMSRFDLGGNRLGADLVLSDDANRDRAAMAWTGDSFIVAWVDRGESGVVTRAVSEDGTLLSEILRVSSSAVFPREVAVASGAPSHAVIAWETRSGSSRTIYAVAVDPLTGALDDEIRLTDEHTTGRYPTVAAIGSKYALAWYAYSQGTEQIMFCRLSAAGALVQPPTAVAHAPTRVAVTAGPRPTLAAGSRSWGLAYRGTHGIVFTEIASDGLTRTPERLVHYLGHPENGSAWSRLTWDGSRFVLAYRPVVLGYGEAMVKTIECATDQAAQPRR